MISVMSALRRCPAAGQPALTGVPEIEYPSPLSSLPDEPQVFVVKNTFIDTPNGQPSSLLGSSAFAPRAVRSCPGSKCAGLLSGCDEEAGSETPATARSRSMSEDESTCASDAGDDTPPTPALPEFNYPAAEFSVRNTFIDTRLGGHIPSMVDDAFEERRIRSCPTSRLGMPGDVEAQVALDAPSYPSGSACQQEEDDDDFTPSPEMCSREPEPDEDWRDEWDSFVPDPVLNFALPDAVESAEPAPEYMVLLATAALEESWAPLSFVPPPPEPFVLPAASTDQEVPAFVPLLGSPECPTVGSRLHCLGDCRPCAHAFTKGCNNGVECRFCHLCAPGELKRRQKERRVQIARQQAIERRADGSGNRGRRGGRRP